MRGHLYHVKPHWIEELTPRAFILVIIQDLRGGVILLAHDACRNMKADVYIGDNCFLGNRVIVLPGVRIGNECVIGSGSIVTKNIPDNCIAVGNPARVICSNVRCGRYGVILDRKNG